MQLSTLKLILIFLPIMLYKALSISPKGKCSDKDIFKQVRVMFACCCLVAAVCTTRDQTWGMCMPGKLSAIDLDLQNNLFFSYFCFMTVLPAFI